MQADVVIIGGGVAGLTLGAELAASAKVVVFEAESVLGYHTSGRSAALYEPAYGAPAVRGLTIASGAAYREGGYLSPRGLMLVARESERAAFDADFDDMGLSPLSMDEARALVPILADEICCAGITHGPQDIDTDRLLQEAARKIRASGGQILTRARVSEISREGAVWRLRAGEIEVSAAAVVNAAGSWVGQVAQMAGVSGPQFTAYRRSVARVAAPEGHDVRGWPMLFGPGETWYAKPDAGALLISPAEEFAMEPHDAWAEDMVLAEGIERYEAYVKVPVSRMIANWAGLRTFAPDRCLVIGADPVSPGFYWQAGQGGYGFQTAPGAARLGADLILGRAPDLDAELVAALSPQRFV